MDRGWGQDLPDHPVGVLIGMITDGIVTSKASAKRISILIGCLLVAREHLAAARKPAEAPKLDRAPHGPRTWHDHTETSDTTWNSAHSARGRAIARRP
jgi:hypothetical protein